MDVQEENQVLQAYQVILIQHLSKMGRNEYTFKKGELPKVGKQFSKDYQPDIEVWTEDEVYRLFNDLVEWFNSSTSNIFFEEFLFDNPNIGERPGKLYPDLISNLIQKFPSFIDLYKLAKKKQEIRLTKYSAHDKINAGMAKFLLSAIHGLKEKSEVDTNLNINKTVEGIETFDEMVKKEYANSKTKESV